MYGVNDEEVDGDQGYHQGGPGSLNGIGTTSPQLEDEVCVAVFSLKIKQRRNDPELFIAPQPNFDSTSINV